MTTARRILLLSLTLLGASVAAGPASAAILRILYPRFDASGYRADGRRIGWTSVQTRKDGAQVLLVEQLEAEGGSAPGRFELAVLEGPPEAPRVTARRTGWEGFSSGETCAACERRMVGMDLADFLFCPAEVALGIVTETVSLRAPSRVRRDLELWRQKEGTFSLLARVTVREEERAASRPPHRVKDARVVFLQRRGQPCRDLQIRERREGETEEHLRVFRWSGERYVEEAPDAVPDAALKAPSP